MSDHTCPEALDFILLVGRQLHRYGAAAHHIEAALNGISGRFCDDGQFFVTPTAIICSVEMKGKWHSRMLRLRPEGIDLGRLSRLDEVGDLVVNGQLTLDGGIRRIKEIDDYKGSKVATLLRIIFFVLGSTAFSCFFIFDLPSIAGVAGLSCLASIFLEVERRVSRLKEMRDFFLAVLISFLTYALSIFVDSLSVNRIILSSLIILIPGLSITIALSEIATNNWLAGTARLMGALAELLKITFGVVMGALAARSLWGVQYSEAIAQSEFLIPESLILLCCSLSFSYTLANRFRDYMWVVLAAFFAYYAARAGTQVFGQELGVFCGGVALAAFSNTFARFLKRPALTVLIPGLIPMVPGSIGYRSLTSMYHQDINGAMTATFSLVIVAVALVAGLTIGNMFVHPRRSI